MDTIFIKSKNSKTSKPHVLILEFTDKQVNIELLYQLLVFITHGKT